MKSNKKQLEYLRNKHKLSLILLHGSQVDGKIHNKSDVDIAVVRKDDKTKIKLLELIKDLSDSLETDKIDLSDLTHADPLLLFSVAKKSKLLSGNTDDYKRLQKTAYHKYCDYLPFLQKEKEQVTENIKKYVAD
jgi:predicted nucleotidyltransferase